MAIIKKTELQRHIDELESRYAKLKTVVSGSEPNPNLFDQFTNNPEQYQASFTEVDLAALEYALSDFKGSLDILKNLKKLQTPRLGK